MRIRRINVLPLVAVLALTMGAADDCHVGPSRQTPVIPTTSCGIRPAVALVADCDDTLLWTYEYSAAWQHMDPVFLVARLGAKSVAPKDSIGRGYHWSTTKLGEPRKGADIIVARDENTVTDNPALASAVCKIVAKNEKGEIMKTAYREPSRGPRYAVCQLDW